MKSRFLSSTLLCLVLLLTLGTGLFAQGEFTVAVLDCKLHGLVAVLKTPGGKTWLVDMGPGPKADFYAARDVIGPFLEQAGVKALDGIVISHPHGDHRGGLPFFIEKYKISQLVDGGYKEISGGEMETYRKQRAQWLEQ